MLHLIACIAGRSPTAKATFLNTIFSDDILLLFCSRNIVTSMNALENAICCPPTPTPDNADFSCQPQIKHEWTVMVTQQQWLLWATVQILNSFQKLYSQKYHAIHWRMERVMVGATYQCCTWKLCNVRCGDTKRWSQIDESCLHIASSHVHLYIASIHSLHEPQIPHNNVITRADEMNPHLMDQIESPLWT